MNKIKSILTVFILLTLMQFAYGQDMRWVQSNPENISDLAVLRNPQTLVCYDLEYTPEKSGVLTSYTTGFMLDCKNGKMKINSNRSIVIKDNSEENYEGCGKFNKILLNCSGNTGGLSIQKSKPVILHQLCLELGIGEFAKIEMDPVTQLTVSIDERPEVYTTDIATLKEIPFENQHGNFYSPDSIELHSSSNEQDVLLSWDAYELGEAATCIVERSEDDTELFEELAILELDISDQINGQYFLFDSNLLPNDYTYQVKCRNDKEKVIFSNSVFEQIDVNSSGLKIYPNPANDYLNIIIDNKLELGKIEVFDTENKLVMVRAAQPGKSNKILLDSLPAGIYNFRVGTTGSTETHRVVIIK